MAEQQPSSGADHLVTPVLKNIVATVNLCCKLDLKKIAAGALNVEYNPRRYGAAIMRIREPKATALIYYTGKIVVTGARDEHSSMLAARKFARIIQKLGFPDVGFKGFKIRNMVAAADLGFLLCLHRLHFAHHPSCTYEPELFPGLFFRMAQPKVSFLVFTSGKVVVVGAKTREEITQAFDNIYPVLLGFKKPVPVDTPEQQHIHRRTPEEEDDEVYRSLQHFSSSPTVFDFT